MIGIRRCGFSLLQENEGATNCDGPILSSKFTQHCSSIPRILSDFLDPYFHAHFFVLTQNCLLSNRLRIHKEIKKILSVKKASTCSFVREMFFVLKGSAQEQTQRFLYENSIHAFKGEFLYWRDNL